MASTTVTTSYLLGNLHCPTCVATIKFALDVHHQILWVSPNIVTSVVTVEHADDPALVRRMADTLEGAGFEICGVETTGSASDDDSARFNSIDLEADASQAGLFSTWPQIWRRRGPSSTSPSVQHAAHLENCEVCQKSPREHRSTAKSSDAKVHSQEVTTAPLDGVVAGGSEQQPTWRATLSIGGMTCAVCVNTITHDVEQKPWISKVVVNLVANSATVDFTEAGRVDDIIEAIEDLGYDAALDKVVSLGEKIESAGREVEIKIDGIFCTRCPDRVVHTLRSFTGLNTVQAPTIDKPFVKVRYTPTATLTIRHILRSIEATDPSLSASIYHPPTLEERSRAIRAKHLRELLLREILTLVIAIPTFVFGIVYMSLVPDSDATKHFLMKPWASGLSRLQVILCILATPVYFFAADIFHTRAFKELRALWRPGSQTPVLARFYRFGSMNMLMSLGTTIAYVSSVAEMIAGAAGKETHIPDGRFYFDSVVFLTLFLLAGRLIESYSKSKTGDAVEALGRLRPSTALLVESDKLTGQVTTATVGIDELEVGDVIRVPHGASPAADGIIVSGSSSFDESSLTGESRPISKGEGDEVFAGTVNKASAITVRVTGASGKSMLDQIVDVVREGQAKRAPVEAVADVLTTYFVPAITLIALITWVVWMVLALTHKVAEEELGSSGGAVAFAFQFAIAVFVVACPCGLALAAPTAMFVGGGIAAQHGILAKGGGEAFEMASKIGCVIFDKTGTITIGESQVTDSHVLTGHQDVLAGLKAVEENSTHPIARAVVAFCEIEAAEVHNVDELPGRGLRASYVGRQRDIAVGNELLMRELEVSTPPEVTVLLETWKSEAKSVALVAVKDDGTWSLAAALAISDPIRPEAAAAVAALRSRGTEVWMLSGDNATTAAAVARRVGISADKVLAEVLPSQKADKVKFLQASGQRPVAMVGDGINDSPALATADVGVAIGSGSDVAISSAHFVLATSSLAAVVTLLELSRAVLRRVKVNFAWAIVYNLVAVPVAAGCLWAVQTPDGNRVRLDPVWASLAMALSSISVVLSSLSLRWRVPVVGWRSGRKRNEMP